MTRHFQILRQKGTTNFFYQYRTLDDGTGEWFRSLIPTLIMPKITELKAWDLYFNADPPEDAELISIEMTIPKKSEKKLA